MRRVPIKRRVVAKPSPKPRPVPKVSTVIKNTGSLPWLVVICRHKREVHSWAERLCIPFIIYEKDNSKAPYCVPVNKGHEASAYLKFCIDHYDKLPERTVFIHDHEFARHHQGSIVDLVREQVALSPRMHNFNISPRYGDVRTGQYASIIKEWYDECLAGELGPYEQHGNWTLGKVGSAQFVVHRDIIRKRSLDFYTKLYRWILTTPLTSYVTSRMMEKTWELFWRE